MKPDAKKTATNLLFALSNPSPSKSTGMGGESEDEEEGGEGGSLEDAALESAASDVMAAIKAGDTTALAAALKAAVTCCGSED